MVLGSNYLRIASRRAAIAAADDDVGACHSKLLIACAKVVLYGPRDRDPVNTRLGQARERSTIICLLNVTVCQVISVAGEIIRSRRKYGVNETATKVIPRSRRIEETVDSRIPVHTCVTVVSVISGAGSDRQRVGERRRKPDVNCIVEKPVSTIL